MSNFIGIVYGTLKEHGIDTSKMSVQEAIEKFNEINGNKSAGNDKNEKQLTKKLSKINQESATANNAPISQIQYDEVETYGDSSSDNPVKKIDRKNEKELELSINKINSWLSQKKVEHAVIIDKDGNVFENEGDNAWVALPKDVDYEGSIIMHNHTETHAFGKDDIMSMQNFRNAEFRLVDNDYVYKSKFKKELDMPYNTLYLTALNDAYKMGDVSQIDDLIMEHLKEGGYVEYEKSKRNS